MKKAATESCDFCDGTLAPGRTTFEWVRGERRLLIEGVPGDVCNRCGEAYYRLAVYKRIRQIVSSPRRRHRVIQVPVYPFEP